MANISQIRLSGVTYNIVDNSAIHSLDGYATSAQTESAITAATNALAEAIAEQHYQTSGDVENAISGKADTSAVTESINAAVSGKADTTALTVYADSVKYNSTSKYVEFYHGGTGGTKVFEYDASPFLIDGMVESVVITSVTSGASEVQVLEITWNSAAGGQVTDIPLTDIFDASNYYTKSDVDDAISAATSGLAESSAVTQEISAATSGLQETLSAGTGIDITNNVISVTASTTVDQTIIQNSTNAVAGGAVYTALQGKNGVISIDSETLVIS